LKKTNQFSASGSGGMGAAVKSPRRQWPFTRSLVLQVLALVGLSVGLVKAAHLQLWTPESLQDKGANRYERDLVLAAQRGKLLDRKGNELANNITTSAVSLVGSQAKLTPTQRQQLADLLGMKRTELDAKITQAKQGFVYLKRQIELDHGRTIQASIRSMKLPGVYVNEEYRRYYPSGDASAQLLGTMNLSGEAIDGLEVTLNEQLAGIEGSRRVVRTGVGNVVDNLDNSDPAQHGRDVKLTLDNNLQYLVYSELRSAVLQHSAMGGSAVMLDAKTGEILALANYPSYDPNKAGAKKPGEMRNRAVTDPFEPGSTIKPFTMSLALEKGVVTNNSTFTGEPFMVGKLRVNDGDHSHAHMTLSEVMQYSSNVGTVKMARQLSNADMHAWFSAAGIGQALKLPIGGASIGRLRNPERWQEIEKTTMSYGYGFSVSLLQLARAYTAFTNNGEVLPLSVIKTDTPAQGVRLMKPEVANTLKGYLERVTEPKGTAPLAQVANYSTGGKTGTARKQSNGGYADNKYIASFVGFAPASNPRVIVAVMVDEPKGLYYGGQVAAPVFANIVSSTMRVLNVQPDAPNRPVVQVPAVMEGPL
jgi:cell division protein FtsI (penicillin-binding protein 3)